MSFARHIQPHCLGRAVCCTREIVGHEPVLVSLADLYADIGGDVIGVEAVLEANAHKYGTSILRPRTVAARPEHGALQQRSSGDSSKAASVPRFS